MINKKSGKLPFDKKLILNQFLLSRFGVDNFQDLSKSIKNPHLEIQSSDGHSGFYEELLCSLGNKILISQDKLADYDLNIMTHLAHINEKRNRPIKLKYFQYLSLLFTEYYLDNYFNNKQKFLLMLNNFLDCFNLNCPQDKIQPYQENDLNKIAFWNATGSGKTLLMHINYYQYIFYDSNLGDDDLFILMTPKEGLSQQHLDSFKESNIKAKIYDKDESMMFSIPREVKIIENTKIGLKDGQKTVSVERFGNKNIVFVDEGHRGASGDTWYNFRNMICKDGFSFEYSATFGQAIEASNDESLRQEYCKCILFDYSYKYFYSDGFGKDYNIFNLSNNENIVREKYLTAGLLMFYQQKKLFLLCKKSFSKFNIENPLFIFVGASVNAVRKENDCKISDVVSVVNYFRDFIQYRSKFVSYIGAIIDGKSGLVDNRSNNLFENSYQYLKSLNQSADDIYDDIKKVVFNCTIDSAILHIEKLKNISGEICLKIGEADPFGVINVGDDMDLLKLFKANGYDAKSVDFSQSLFNDINKSDSKINLLIGSKKFSEGWNCWRVSCMGLMNIGRGEGSEIIQLFGRGVRLKGYDYSLKRTSAIIRERFDLLDSVPDNIYILETLNVFGIRADYMRQFKEYLDAEGVEVEKLPSKIFQLSVKTNSDFKKYNLKTLSIKHNLSFKDTNTKIIFSLHDIVPIVELDCYPKIQMQSSQNFHDNQSIKEECFFSDEHLQFFDYDKIYFELVQYKKATDKINLCITKQNIVEMSRNKSWYKLLIPREDMVMHNIEDCKRFERLFITLLKMYMDKLYNIYKRKWETMHLEYCTLDEHNASIIDKYTIQINSDSYFQNIIDYLNKYVSVYSKSTNQDLMDFNDHNLNIECMWLNESLYSPLVYLSKFCKDVFVSPVNLVESERDFLLELKNYINKNSEFFNKNKLFLLRNPSKKGTGFFETGGFYPDFIMWLIVGEKQYINFIDPHGMIFTNIMDEKVQLYKKLSEIQTNLKNSNIVLNSFILSPTRYRDLVHYGHTMGDWHDNNVFFMKDDDKYLDLLFQSILSK